MDSEEASKASQIHASHSTNFHSQTRIAELEVENRRLQRIVAELLIKNQQLRKPGA